MKEARIKRGSSTCFIAIAVIVTFSLSASCQPLVSNTFHRTDIKEALRILADQSGINILVSPGVEGEITLELRDTPLEEALVAILSPGGYIFEEKDSYYLVGPPDNSLPVFQHLSSTEVIKIINADATIISRTLPFHLTQYIKVDAKRNALVVTAPSRIVEEVRSYIELIDGPPKLVGVEMTVVEVVREKGTQLGIDWRWTWLGQEQDHEGVSIDQLAIGYTSKDILANLMALASEGHARIVASPRTLCLDGQATSITVDTNYYVQVGEVGVGRLQTVSTGVTFTVRPVVVSLEEILVELEASVGNMESVTEGIPRTITRTARTSAITRVGQPLAIAGFSEEAQRMARENIAQLGEIPVANFLFGTDESSEQQKELIVLITPYLLAEDYGAPENILAACNWSGLREEREANPKKNNPHPSSARFSLECTGLFKEEDAEGRGYHIGLTSFIGSPWSFTVEYGSYEENVQDQTLLGVTLRNNLRGIAENFFMSLAYQDRHGKVVNDSKWEQYQSYLYLVSLMQANQIAPQLSILGEINLSYMQENPSLSLPIYGWAVGLMYQSTLGFSLEGKYRSFLSEEDKYNQSSYAVQLVSRFKDQPWNITVGYQRTDEQDIRNLLGMFGPHRAYYAGFTLYL